MDRRNMVLSIAGARLGAGLPMAWLNTSNAHAWPPNFLLGLPSVEVPGATEYLMRPNQIPLVLEQLQWNARDGSWATLMFSTAISSADTDDSILNLQYSVEEGIAGLDWVLLGPRNIAELEQVAAFAASRGHQVMVRTMNNVSYLRVEDGDIGALGQSIIAQYGIPSDNDIGLLASAGAS
ncbi:MAG: hypothetical protein EPN61_11230 [Burkholderiaceae bacterium]|nr:MAG: hypothetical protein EPN61_11230 [Burkholderiaceae bacterium]